MFKRIKKFLAYQAQNNRNRSVVHFLSDLGYPQKNIRRSLMVLNGVKYADFQDQIHPVTLSRVVITGHGGKKAKKVYADKFNLNPEELFGDSL